MRAAGGFERDQVSPVPFVQVGSGKPIVCLHSGWGRSAMPFDDAVAALGSSWRFIFPDRIGYGRAERVDALPTDFHRREAERLAGFLASLRLEHPVVWGHSDGAVIAAMCAAAHPRAIGPLVLESIHLHKDKAKPFFLELVEDPDSLPPAVRAKLRAEHGDPYWRDLLRAHSRAWLALGAEGGDYFGDELSEIQSPTLVVLGESDPHTQVEEAQEIADRIPGAKLAIIPGAGHSPHSEASTAGLVTRRIQKFLSEVT